MASYNNLLDSASTESCVLPAPAVAMLRRMAQRAAHSEAEARRYFAAQLKAARLKLGIRHQNTFADMIGVEHETYRRWERGVVSQFETTKKNPAEAGRSLSLVPSYDAAKNRDAGGLSDLPAS